MTNHRRVRRGARKRRLPLLLSIWEESGRSTAGYGGSDTLRKKFTGKERDVETGLGYFEARYYSSVHGRFTSPDEFTGGPEDLFDFADEASNNPTFYANLSNPQSLNKYQYAYNNPLRFVDPDGHDADEQQGQNQDPTPPPRRSLSLVPIVL